MVNNPLSTAIQATDTSLTLFSLLLLLLLFLFFIAAVIAKVDSQQTSEDGRLLFTVMEYVPSGDVSHHIQQRGTLSEDEARKRKLQRKAERRKEKMASDAASAGDRTLYVSGIPTEISWTAVQSLFARVGPVQRVKLYKDAAGEQKGWALVDGASVGLGTLLAPVEGRA